MLRRYPRSSSPLVVAPRRRDPRWPGRGSSRSVGARGIVAAQRDGSRQLDAPEWNYLQVEVDGARLHPVAGPGGLTRAQAHARVRALLVLHAETTPYAAALVEAWEAGAEDDTVYAGPLLWAIYAAPDAAAGARAWVEDLALRLRGSGSTVRIAW